MCSNFHCGIARVLSKVGCCSFCLLAFICPIDEEIMQMKEGIIIIYCSQLYLNFLSHDYFLSYEFLILHYHFLSCEQTCLVRLSCEQSCLVRLSYEQSCLFIWSCEQSCQIILFHVLHSKRVFQSVISIKRNILFLLFQAVS